MRNVLKTDKFRARRAARSLAALTLAVSMAAFGCTTNQNRASGEPAMNTTPAGSATPHVTTTPGTSSATTPPPMVSAAVDPSVDAIAVLKANEGFRGKNLGAAVPGTNPQGGGASLQQVSGQFISPSVLANPQNTVNSSVSSAPVPGIESGAAGDGGALIAVPGGTGLSGAVTAGPTVAPSTTPGAGVVSPSSTNTVTSPATNTATSGATATTQAATSVATGTNVVVGTGLVNAPAIAGSVLATPTTGINAERATLTAPATVSAPATTSGSTTTARARLAARSGLNLPATTRNASSGVRVETIAGRVTLTNATSARSNQ